MRLLLFAICAPVILPAAFAELPVKSTRMRDVVTHEQIVEAARKAQEEAPPPVFTPLAGKDPSVANKPGDLLSRSDILCFQGRATLVPKRAVLHVPKELSDRLKMQEGAQISSWTDFLNSNRAWIRTVAVTRVQAEGNHPMPEETLKSFEKEKRLVVATYQEGPISVLPLKVADPAAVPGSPAAATAQPVNAAKP
jgi:hypothetical protein